MISRPGLFCAMLVGMAVVMPAQADKLDDIIASGKLRCAVVAVENPRHALGKLAARYRRDFHLPVIAVGGSNGKTTTKELLAAVLRQRFKTLWNDHTYWRITGRTIGIAAAVTVTDAVLAFPLAYFMARGILPGDSQRGAR